MAKAATKSDNAPIRFKLFGETKGAVRYQEVDKNGKDVDTDKHRIGTLYFRKSQFGQISAVTYPEFLVVNVTVEDAGAA